MWEVTSEAPLPRVRKGTPRKRTDSVPFRERPFVAWDGEGDTERDTYILFGCSAGHEISSPSLRFTECADLMMRVARMHPNTIHVAFAFDYDVTMMCASLPESKRYQLAKEGHTWFNHYRIEYRSKKWFVVTDRDTRTTLRIFDGFSFFACSAMKAWADYLPDEDIFHEVVAGKRDREFFRYDQLPTIRKYMRLELKLYVKLFERLRALLAQLNVFPRGWYGPGAVASAVMTKFGIRKAMDRELPTDVIVASQHAYFGGRFEQFHAGRYDGTIYTADIRSAYPHALRQMPTLAGGVWQHRDYPTSRPYEARCLDFSLYKVSYRKNTTHSSLFTPSPLPFRDVRHCVHYPNHVVGWYWGVEVNAAIDGLHADDTLDLLEAWEFIPATHERPFQFIEDLFIQRQQWKNERNPVQHAAKLVMNSIYGKLAQRVGWNRETMKPPTWHQLEWAGFTTAYCRAMVYRAICQNPHAVVAVETDGLFSTQPLSLGEDAKRLGDWESDTLQGLIYIQSGVYWKRRDLGYDVTDEYGWDKVKIRGMAPGDIPFERAMEALPTLADLTADTHRFAALKGYWNKPTLAHWLDTERHIVWGGGGKRHHNDELCPKCLGDESLAMHPLTISAPHGGESIRHVLPWRDIDPNPWWVIADAHIAISLPTQ